MHYYVVVVYSKYTKIHAFDKENWQITFLNLITYVIAGVVCPL